MSVANLEAYALSQGISQSYQKMSQANQAALRYSYLLSVTADAQGDFSRTSDSWANQTKILSLQFDSLKTTIGGLLIEVLSPLLRMLNKIMTAANKAATAIAALFGKKESTGGAFSATAESADEASDSIDDTGTAATKAAKKIKNAFASFDEINVLSLGKNDSDSDADASAGTSIAEESDIASQGVSETEKKLDSLKNKLQNLWKGFASGFESEKKALLKNIADLKTNAKKTWTDIKSLGTPLKEWASTDLVNMFSTYAHVIAGVFLGLFESVNMVWGDIWDVAAFPIIQKFVTVGLPMLTQFKTETLLLYQTLFDSIKELFDSVWTEGMVPALTVVSGIYTDLIDTFSGKWKQHGAPVFDGIKKAFTSTKDIILSVWTNHIEPCWNALMEAVDELWKEHLKPLIDEIAEFTAEFTVMATNIYNNFITPVVLWLQEKLFPVFNRIFNNILNVVKPIVAGIIDSVSGVITTLKGVVQFISGVFSGDWNKAWTGIKNVFSGIWKTISSTLKTPINAIFSMIENLVNRCIYGINALIRGFNSIKWNVPDWVPGIGGKSIGFNIRQMPQISIPRLAEGGWVRANNPQLAIVGDNRREGEIIAPESKITEAVEKARGIARDIKLAIDVVVNYPDGRRIIKQINQAQLEEGRILLEV
jgi:phage-related protein